MVDETRLDGNAIAGELRQIFGVEMTDHLGCCGECGTVNRVAAITVYRTGPGDVLRCPNCEAVLFVLVQRDSTVTVGFDSIRWLRMAR